MLTFRDKAVMAASLICLISLGCSRTEKNASSQTTGGNSNVPAAQTNSGAQSASTGAALDTKKYDAEINRLEKEVEKTPGDDTARSSLAKAYLTRGNVLAAAHQTKAALADYRSALHLDPDNEEAQQKTAATRKEIGGNAPDEDAGEPVDLPPSPDALDDGGTGESNPPARHNKKGEPKKAG